MRLLLILVSLFIVSESSAQILHEELYSEYNSELGGLDFGTIISINDTLAILDFYKSNRHNSQIVVVYQYKNDSLILSELDTLIEFNRRVECTYNKWWEEKNSVYIGYGSHYFNRGYMYFDTLTFEVDGTLHRAQIGTIVNYISIERPLKDQFLIKVYDDSILTDSFEVRLPKEKNTILFDKDVIETSYSHFGSTNIFPISLESIEPPTKLIQERLPDYLTIDGKEYKLIVRLIYKETDFTLD